MPTGDAEWVIFGLGMALASYLAFKAFVPWWIRSRDPKIRAANAKIKELRKAASDPKRGAEERAEAWREAASIALIELERPAIAAGFARRADELDAAQPETVGLIARAMRRSARLLPLERYLWQRLARDDRGAAYQRAYEELIRLYEGPLRRPEKAAVLRTLRPSAEGHLRPSAEAEPALGGETG